MASERMPGRNYATAERTTIAKHNSAFMHRELRLRLRELTSSSMRWLAKSESVAVSHDGASCSHECNSWDTACGDTWFSQGIVTIELLTDEVDRPSLYAGIVSRDHVFEEDTRRRRLPRSRASSPRRRSRSALAARASA